ncbi:unnamed protein product [Sphenostylis stenocarpa]|uniref:Uncharacterized protein n=1 Tax=Sphenostylis stenocarpa TaxID=92480 RepID=A0AA86V3C5_9FABA|nr:unnamed protein product [Sphenostylis stenocarpa]
MQTLFHFHIAESRCRISVLGVEIALLLVSQLQLYSQTAGWNYVEGSWQGNFETWVQDPLHVRPIAHAIWDPHFGQPAVEAFTRGGALGPVNIAYSGRVGYTCNQNGNQVFRGLKMPNPASIIICRTIRSKFLGLDRAFSPCRYSGVQGEYVRWNNLLGILPHPSRNCYSNTSRGFHPQTQSLWLTDIAHHHLAIAFLFLVAGHMYRTNFGIGHSIKDLLEAHTPPGGRLGRGHKGLYDTINNSIHFQLGLALASLGVITSLVAQHMYSLPAYAFIAQDFTTQAALYTHHQYIAGFIMTGAFAHGAIFFIRDYNPEQ